MSHRTAALLFLFLAALGVTGFVLALTLRVVEGSGWSQPWLAPVIAVVCYTAILFLGRRHILPAPVADASVRAALALAATVVLTLAGTLLVMWTVQWALGSAIGAPTVALPLWFALLWGAVRRQQRWTAP